MTDLIVTLLKAIVRALQLDFAYAHFGAEIADGPREVLQLGGLQDH